MMLIDARRLPVGAHATGALMLLGAVGGCGVLGSPIPPEDVGVTPVIERQLRREGLLPPGATVWGSASRPNAPSAVVIEESSFPPVPEPLPIPPLREMGTR